LTGRKEKKRGSRPRLSAYPRKRGKGGKPNKRRRRGLGKRGGKAILRSYQKNDGRKKTDGSFRVRKGKKKRKGEDRNTSEKERKVFHEKGALKRRGGEKGPQEKKGNT